MCYKVHGILSGCCVNNSSRCMPTLSLYTLYSKIATWLILPVVICLSQRLSHACLSSSENKVKPRMAHYISYGSLDRTYYLDNCGNSRANTCVGLQPSWKERFY